MSKAKPERTGWRDLKLNDRHRRWGLNCPMVDIDFLACEYDQGRAVAIVEYKHERAAKQKPSHPSYRALKNLADLAGISFFAVRYKEDFSSWLVVPLNRTAITFLPKREWMTEQAWVALLYTIRGRNMPVDLFAKEK